MGLWTCDLLPFFLPFFFLLLLLRTQLFPPTPAELLERLRTRSSLSAEAVSLSSSLKTTSRFGFAVEGAKGVFASLRPDKSEGGALMRGLHGSAMVGGLAGGLGAGKGMEREREREPSALAKALRHSSFVASGVAAPDRRGEGGLGNSEAGKEAEREAEREVEREVERETTKEKEEERRRDAAARLRKDPDGDVSAYKLATELTRTFGPLTQDYMSGAADLAEKVKKCVFSSRSSLLLADAPSPQPAPSSRSSFSPSRMLPSRSPLPHPPRLPDLDSDQVRLGLSRIRVLLPLVNARAVPGMAQSAVADLVSPNRGFRFRAAVC